MICLIKNLKMKIKKIIFFYFLIFLFISIECKIQVTNFCTKIEIEGNKIECSGEFGLSCSKNTCSKDQFSCQGLKLLVLKISKVLVKNMICLSKYMIYS